ncbi:hypothetical protein PghCCS26_37330 [Paenibacillus glycanilyticus]|uniref:Uncharacterized protein n=1 Tax=Paenibacillus glycanilyticus TaxID=126569 RepID=A0ABQ6NRH8_9BACL|nr:hypothetical protein [Paenibacillus glycanilyticus]GMK46604.1 hypothetical protein PghCCS26_37330 [Paenibacillus glycanilyticus]
MNMTEERCAIVTIEARRKKVLAYIHSDAEGWKEAGTAQQLQQVYEQHRPLYYDIYLDLCKGEWLARGEAMELSGADVCVLFRMITEGLSCTSEMIFMARYKQELEPGNKKDRGRLDSYYRRLKERLKLYGITTEHYTVKPGTRYFVIYPEQWNEESGKR